MPRLEIFRYRYHHIVGKGTISVVEMKMGGKGRKQYPMSALDTGWDERRKWCDSRS